MKQYKHLFFDLDHTLWDYEKSSAETLLSLYQRHELAPRGVTSIEDFQQIFKEVNEELWSLFNQNKIHKDQIREARFSRILEQFTIKDDQLSNILSDQYLMECPEKPYVLPYAEEILTYLKPNYELHVLTNGFDDVQFTKLKACGLLPYFKEVITSDRAGEKKPHADIFHYALKVIDAEKEECLMIGDNLHTDIKGAADFEMDHVFYNPGRLEHKRPVMHEIHHLQQLEEML